MFVFIHAVNVSQNTTTGYFPVTLIINIWTYYGHGESFRKLREKPASSWVAKYLCNITLTFYLP